MFFRRPHYPSPLAARNDADNPFVEMSGDAKFPRLIDSRFAGIFLVIIFLFAV